MWPTVCYTWPPMSRPLLLGVNWSSTVGPPLSSQAVRFPSVSSLPLDGGCGGGGRAVQYPLFPPARPFPATASAEGRQFNGAPSPARGKAQNILAPVLAFLLIESFFCLAWKLL